MFQTDHQDQICLELKPSKPPTTQSYRELGLGSLSKEKVARPERLRIGLSTVLLVASTGGTSWLSHNSELILIGDTFQPNFQPYIMHSSILNTIQESKPSAGGFHDIFFLGVVLLELIFGESFEARPRSGHLGVDGKPNELTDFCTAMEWVKVARCEVGCLLADGVEWCLKFLINQGPDMMSPECLQGIWEKVVLPLEMFLKLWLEHPVP